MFEGKERRKDLIGEVRTTHALQAPEQKEKRWQNEEVLSLQHEREAMEHKVGVEWEGRRREGVYERRVRSVGGTMGSLESIVRGEREEVEGRVDGTVGFSVRVRFECRSERERE